jgi:uncharacterized protein
MAFSYSKSIAAPQALLLRMRNPRWLSSLLLLAATLPSCAEKVATLPAPTGYIDDYAAVLSAPAKIELEQRSRDLHDQTGAQVFVVTVKTLEGAPIETFANDLFRKWKIGEKKTDRGVLMLFAINDRKDRIEVGYGIEAILNDAKTGDIGREMVPALQASHYDDAIRTGLNDISEIIATDANVTLDTAPPPPAPPAQRPLISSPRAAKWVFLSFFGGMWVLLLWAAWFFRKPRLSSRPSTPSTGKFTGFTTPDTDSGSNYWNSFHSSGDSFGGGDGGDSGGGGSSGSW